MHVFAKNTLFSIDSIYHQQHFWVSDILRWWTDPQMEFDLLSDKCVGMLESLSRYFYKC